MKTKDDLLNIRALREQAEKKINDHPHSGRGQTHDRALIVAVLPGAKHPGLKATNPRPRVLTGLWP